MHSFWYPEALVAFQAALRLDSEYAMAWWGIAMCFNRPYLAGSNDDAGRRALAQIRDTTRLAARERAYIDALRTFYADGPIDARTVAYASAMEKVYRNFPDDLEAASFYALSLLGYRWSSEEGSARQERAGAIASEVYRRRPTHPGAAHYVIHSYDEPALAPRGIAAARHYAEIAPEAPHALHMPSHIFLQLGMWPEVIASNETAWAASEEWVRRKALPPTYRDYHNLHWLIYGCLQEGRYARASELLERFCTMRVEIPSLARHYLDDTLAAYLVETRSWERAEALLAQSAPSDGAGAQPDGAQVCGQIAADGIRRTGADARNFITAYVAALQGGSGAGRDRDRLRVAALGDDATAKLWRMRWLMVSALANVRGRSFPDALASLRQAAQLDEELGRSPGPPSSYKPPYELLGETLLSAGEPAEARSKFEQSLQRNPNRPLSLLGAARAAAAVKDRAGALEYYRRFRETWRSADRDRPELREAEEFERSGTK